MLQDLGKHSIYSRNTALQTVPCWSLIKCKILPAKREVFAPTDKKNVWGEFFSPPGNTKKKSKKSTQKKEYNLGMAWLCVCKWRSTCFASTEPHTPQTTVNQQMSSSFSLHGFTNYLQVNICITSFYLTRDLWKAKNKKKGCYYTSELICIYFSYWRGVNSYVAVDSVMDFFVNLIGQDEAAGLAQYSPLPLCLSSQW